VDHAAASGAERAPVILHALLGLEQTLLELRVVLVLPNQLGVKAIGPTDIGEGGRPDGEVEIEPVRELVRSGRGEGGCEGVHTIEDMLGLGG